MKTYKIKKVPLMFYYDYVIKNNTCYVFQETKDGWVHTKKVCTTNSNQCSELAGNGDFIEITI